MDNTSETFNPYLKWLGIPHKYQPPNHYRLLGLEPLEGDPDVIESAADRQMAHVRTFRTGKRMQLAEQLLNELSEARVTLLNPDKKRQYDAALKKTAKAAADSTAAKKVKPPSPQPQRPKASPLPAAAPRAAAPPSKALTAQPVATAGTVAEQGGGPVVVSGGRGSVGGRGSLAARRRQPPWAVVGIVGAAGLAFCLIAVLAVSALTTAEDTAVADSAGPSRPSDFTPAAPDAARHTSTQPRGGAGTPSGPGRLSPTLPGNSSDESPLPPLEPSGANTSDTSTTDPANRTVDSSPELPSPQGLPDAASESPGESGDGPPGPPGETRPRGLHELVDGPPNVGAPDVAAGPARPKPPAADVQGQIENRVRELYAVSAQSTPQQQAELARKLLEDGKATKDNLDDRYVVLRVAAETAAGAGDFSTAMKAVDVLERDFALDAAPLRLEFVERVVRAAPPAEKAEAIRSSLAVLDAALGGNHFKDVDKAALSLLGHTRRLNDRDLSTALIDRRRNAAALGEMYDKAIAGHETLRAKPDDAAANTAVGSFWIFAKGDWEKGLPHLAKGSDVELAALARRELEPPQAGQDKADLGNDWLARGKKADTPANTAMLQRAKYWYEAAQNDVSGLARTALDRNLAEVVKLLGDEQPAASAAPVARMARIFAAGDLEFELHINGQYVMEGRRPFASLGLGPGGRGGRGGRGGEDAVQVVDRELKSGDVIMVRGRKSQRRNEKGFACVIAFEGDAKPLVTGDAPWQAYLPSSEESWSVPGSVVRTGPVQLGDSTMHNDVRVQSGLPCQSIWSGNDARAYLMLRIP